MKAARSIATTDAMNLPKSSKLCHSETVHERIGFRTELRSGVPTRTDWSELVDSALMYLILLYLQLQLPF